MIEVVQRCIVLQNLVFEYGCESMARARCAGNCSLPLQLLSEALDGMRIEYRSLLLLAYQRTLNYAIDWLVDT